MKVLGYLLVIILLIGFGVFAVKVGWWDALIGLINSIVK